MKILSSLREKKRYLVFEVVSELPIGYEDAVKEIKFTAYRFLGELGMAKAGLMFLKDWKNNRGIIKVSHKWVNEAKTALALVKEIGGKKVIVKSIGLSGILNKAREKYFS